MPVIKWSETLQPGSTATDANHVESCTLLNVVVDASDAEFIGALDTFIDHAEHYFVKGNIWMDVADFPPRHYHRGEHGNVLALCREVYERAAVGEMELGHQLVAELPAWLVQHVDVMGHMMTTYLVQMGNAMRIMEHTG